MNSLGSNSGIEETSCRGNAGVSASLSSACLLELIKDLSSLSECDLSSSFVCKFLSDFDESSRVCFKRFVNSSGLTSVLELGDKPLEIIRGEFFTKGLFDGSNAILIAHRPTSQFAAAANARLRKVALASASA